LAWVTLLGRRNTQLAIVATFEDNGVSGKSLERDGLESALNEARKGKAKAILVWNLARLTRADELDDLLLRKELREMRMPLIVGSTGRDFTSEDEGDELLSGVERWATSCVSTPNKRDLRRQKSRRQS
jgi:DNA invertase Pin-like site-specific DNA recombinase